MTVTQVPLNLHNWIRSGATIAAVTLLGRRFVYHEYPNFLPSKLWEPHSAIARSAGLAADGLTTLILMLALLGLPFCVYFSFRLLARPDTLRPALVDLAFVLVLYAMAYYLLSPPSL